MAYALVSGGLQEKLVVDFIGSFPTPTNGIMVNYFKKQSTSNKNPNLGSHGNFLYFQGKMEAIDPRRHLTFIRPRVLS